MVILVQEHPRCVTQEHPRCVTQAAGPSSAWVQQRSECGVTAGLFANSWISRVCISLAFFFRLDGLDNDRSRHVQAPEGHADGTSSKGLIGTGVRVRGGWCRTIYYKQAFGIQTTPHKYACTSYKISLVGFMHLHPRRGGQVG